MGEWTTERIERLLRAAAKARSAIDEGDPETAPSASISDFRQARRWLQWLDPLDAEIVRMRCSGSPWKPICWQLGISRATGHRRWNASLQRITDRLPE